LAAALVAVVSTAVTLYVVLSGEKDRASVTEEKPPPESPVSDPAAKVVESPESSTPATEPSGDPLGISPGLRKALIDHGVTEVPGSREEAIERLAEALSRDFDPSSRDGLGVHGQVLPSPEGRIHVVYDFNDARQAADFVEVRDYREDLRRQVIREGLPEIGSEKSSSAVRGGAFVGQGATCWRLSLPFGPPFTARGVVSYAPEEHGSVSAFPLFMMGFSDDSGARSLQCYSTGHVTVEDGSSSRQFEPETVDTPAFVDFHFAMRHDGETLEYELGKSLVKATGVERLQEGHFLFWVHSLVPVEIRRLEIEGRLEGGSLEAVRRRWVASRLEDLLRGEPEARSTESGT
jgi:hypothetical protein